MVRLQFSIRGLLVFTLLTGATLWLARQLANLARPHDQTSEMIVTVVILLVGPAGAWLLSSFIRGRPRNNSLFTAIAYALVVLGVSTAFMVWQQ